MRTAKQVVAEVEARTKPSARAKGVADGPKPPRKVSSKAVLGRLETGRTPDRVYITDGLSDGTVKVQDVGMRNIDIDYIFQARERRLDPEHVKGLAEARDIAGGGPLYPVPLFLKPDGRYVPGDGFHRLEENRIRRCATIKAFVIDVPDWEHQARLFASMCNRNSELKRKREDIRKAIQILCADPECSSWDSTRIARHVGTSPQTALRVQQEWAIEHGGDLPKASVRKTAAAVTTAPPPPTRRDPSPPAPARAILLPGCEDEPRPEAVPAPLHNSDLFHRWLLGRGVISKATDRGLAAGFRINGRIAGRFCFVLCHGSDIEGVYAATTRALILNGLVDPDLSAAVVLEKHPAHRRLYEMIEDIGVRCLEAGELVEAIKGG